MTAEVYQLIIEALKLPPATRRELAEALLESVSPGNAGGRLTADALAEFEHRSRDLREGNVAGLPGREMIEELIASRRASDRILGVS
jgi:putative addiction module component (TIGR02574 family)